MEELLEELLEELDELDELELLEEVVVFFLALLEYSFSMVPVSYTHLTLPTKA